MINVYVFGQASDKEAPPPVNYGSRGPDSFWRMSAITLVSFAHSPYHT